MEESDQNQDYDSELEEEREDDFFSEIDKSDEDDQEDEELQVIETDAIENPQTGQKVYKAGRKHKLDNKKLVENILKALKVGATDTDACAFVRLSRNTFYEYMRIGQEDQEAERQSKFRDFYERVLEARTSPKLKAMVVIQKNFKDDPRLALEYLKARHPKEWGRTSIDITTHDDSEVNVKMQQEDARRLTQQLSTLNSFLEGAKQRALNPANEGEEPGVLPPADSEPEGTGLPEPIPFTPRSN
jgi:hypothetical protein